MAHARTTHATATSPASLRAREARRLFFKADRPRAIDRYIDYFGGAGGGFTRADEDLCGEVLLERLA
jgi:hypothetical protein